MLGDCSLLATLHKEVSALLEIRPLCTCTCACALHLSAVKHMTAGIHASSLASCSMGQGMPCEPSLLFSPLVQNREMRALICSLCERLDREMYLREVRKDLLGSTLAKCCAHGNNREKVDVGSIA